MIELDAKDAEWLDSLSAGIAQATKARTDFAKYLAFKYQIPEGSHYDPEKKAFIQGEKPQT